MKILAVAEFDPAGVLHGHRQAMREAGHDYRLAVETVFGHAVEADWYLHSASFDSLAAFAEQADVIQFHPAIGQPWSYQSSAPVVRGECEERRFGPIDWRLFHPKRKIAYFHGSKNAAVNAKFYADHWRSKGYSVWASTLDYAAWMFATYAPPTLTVRGQIARLRGPDEPLLAIQTPTDPGNCHTADFSTACMELGIPHQILTHKSHEEVLKAKSQCHVGFDHLRGAFSVNTLENAALGLVPIWNAQHQMTGVPYYGHGVRIENAKVLKNYLQALDEDPDFTAIMQRHALSWFAEFDGWAREALISHYEKML